MPTMNVILKENLSSEVLNIEAEIKTKDEHFPDLIHWRDMVFIYRQQQGGVGIYTKPSTSVTINWYPNESGPIWRG